MILLRKVGDKNKINQIFKERLHENKNLPQLQQHEHIIKQTIIRTEKYKNTTKKVVTLELGFCPECDSKTYCVDYIHGERVCPQCGYVFDQIIFEKPKYNVPRKISHPVRFSFKEKQYLKSKNYHYVTEAKEWKKRQVEREIDVIASNLQMNTYNKNKVKDIVEKTGLKRLHGTATTTTILCAVARYVLKYNERNNLVALRYDRNIFKNNLNAKEYAIVENNIKKHHGEKYVDKRYKSTKKRKKGKKNIKTNSKRRYKSSKNHIKL